MNIQEIERREGRLLATVEAFKKKYGDDSLKEAGLDEQTLFALAVEMPEFVDSWIEVAESRVKIAELLEPDGGVSKETELGSLVREVVEANKVIVTLWAIDSYDFDLLVEGLMKGIITHPRFSNLVGRGARGQVVPLIEKSVRQTLISSKLVAG